MAGDKGYQEMNFDPTYDMEVFMRTMAEQSIVRVIIEGSGGPENEDFTEDGLRFVRYLLSISRSTRFGFLPNFKDMETIRELARQFIRYCGGASVAMQTMNRVTEGEAA
jgi:hypothetical protein